MVQMLASKVLSMRQDAAQEASRLLGVAEGARNVLSSVPNSKKSTSVAAALKVSADRIASESSSQANIRTAHAQAYGAVVAMMETLMRGESGVRQ